MIKVEQYPIVVPDIYTDYIITSPRTDSSGDRNENRYSYMANNDMTITLPWTPAAQEWVELYKEGTRVLNPRVHTADGRLNDQTQNTIYERFNIVGNVVTFASPISGSLEFVCDTQATHWWGGKEIDCDNIQTAANVFYSANIYLPVEDWPMTRGYQKGFQSNIYFKPGPVFDIENLPPEIKNAVPSGFNGNVVGDPVVPPTPGSMIYSSSIRDDFVADGIASSFNLTKFPSSNNLIVYVNETFVDPALYSAANTTIVANVITGETANVHAVTFLSSPVANANVRIDYVPFGANYQFLTMTTPGTITGIATDFLLKKVGSSLYAEPVVISEPVHGYARLSTNRKRLIYTPDLGFEGTDYFKWAMITQHGQVCEPICIEIFVTSA